MATAKAQEASETGSTAVTSDLPSSAALRFDAPRYTLPGCATPNLVAAEHNVDPGVAEVAMVDLYNQTGSDHELVGLVKTEVNRGVFMNTKG